MKDCKNILAHGESGHAHRVTVAVMEREDGLREFVGPTTVTHEEHKKIDLPSNPYVSGIVKEFDHLQDMERKVID